MIIFVISVLCVLFSSGYQQDTTNAFDYHYLIQDARNNNEGEQTWLTDDIQPIQGNFYDQTHTNKIDPKPCSRRSNSESDSLRRQWIPPNAMPVQLPESPNVKQTSRSNDPNIKAVNSNQDFFTNQPSNDIMASRNSIIINSTPLDSGGEEHDHGLLPTKKVPEPGRLPGFEVKFAPSSAFDLELPNDFFPAPSSSININPSEDLYPKTILRSEPLLMESEYNFQVRPSKSESISPDDSKILRSGPPTKCSDDNDPKNLHSRRSMSSYEDMSYSDSLNSDKDLSQNINDPYDQSRIGNEKALSSVLSSEPNGNKDGKDQKEKSLNNLDKTKTSTYHSVVRSGRPQFNAARREMIEPTRGTSNIGQSALLLMQSERICYACSTANNPSCWAPDRRTTVKYCKKGNNACITKTFGSGSTFTLIRDCGRSCDDSDMGGLMPKYKSCSMCHSELCNSAYSINGQSILFALILTAFIKYLN